LGGYNISQAAELVISKDEKKVLRYKVTNTTIDEYNGSVPKVEMTEGKLKTINNIRYNFLGGNYGKDGAYFQLSKKGLTSSISELTIFFAPGKGSSKFFTK